MSATLAAFIDTANLPAHLARKLLDGREARCAEEMVFNLTQVRFDYAREVAVVSYLVVDGHYPDVELSFQDFWKLVSSRANPGNNASE